MDLSLAVIAFEQVCHGKSLRHFTQNALRAKQKAATR
jgi:hypothetical protein